MQRHTIMRAEVKVDCYGGDSCDQLTPYFDMYCEGDMDSDNVTDDIVIKLSELPPGATVEVKYPCCPECGLPREEKFEFLDGRYTIAGFKEACSCGFDWLEWTLDRYS